MLVSNVFDKTIYFIFFIECLQRQSDLFWQPKARRKSHWSPLRCFLRLPIYSLFPASHHLFHDSRGIFRSLWRQRLPFFGIGSSTWNIICRNCSQQILMFIKRFGLSTRGIFLGLRRHQLYAKKKEETAILPLLPSMLHYSCVLQADKYRRVSIFEFSHPENVPLLCILNYFVWGMLVNISSTLVIL